MTSIGGRYDLQYELGRGAFSAVWVGWDTQLERRVAVKLLHPDALTVTSALSNFQSEARAIARLRSAHIVHVYDVGLSEGRPFMVMELLEGESLENRLVRHSRLPLAMVIRMVAEVCQGLGTTHRAGIVHRDVKPANIFLAQDGGREIAKLLDFGVATLSAKSGPSGVVGGPPLWVGTPAYLSPEQTRGEPVDVRSDLWSLAITAYRAITGHCPFPGGTLAALLEQIRAAPLAAPSTIVQGLGPAVDAFFERALARDPARRFQSAEEFATALLALERTGQRVTRILFLDDEPDMELLLRQHFRKQIREGTYELRFAVDGRSGLEELKRQPDTDVVLTDLNMPGMDGLTFLGHVAAVNPLVRMVVVSAYGDMANIRAAMNRGAFDFLGKPINFEDLQATIDKCAAHVAMIRRAIQSSEENQLMRVLIGHGVVERWLSALRDASSDFSHTADATVAVIDVHGFARGLRPPFPRNVLESLNRYFSLFLQELSAKDGKVIRFVGDAVIAVFEGGDHLVRALDASMAIRLRFRSETGHHGGAGHGVSIGVASGTIMIGSSGSMAMGHMEATVLGVPVSTAARLQCVAAKNEILITERELRQVEADFECEVRDERFVATSLETVRVASVIRNTKVTAIRSTDDRTLSRE